jgi:hypothetical protein
MFFDAIFAGIGFTGTRKIGSLARHNGNSMAVAKFGLWAENPHFRNAAFIAKPRFGLLQHGLANRR